MVADPTVAESRERGLLQLVHPAPPLQRDEGFDPRFAALAERDRMPVRLPRLEQSVLLRPGENALAGLRLGQAGEVARLLVHAPVGPDDHRLGEVVRAPDLEVHGVVARRHLESPRAELRVDPLVGDDRNPPLDERDDGLAAHERAIPLVAGMHGNRDVGEDRRRSSRGDRDVPLVVGTRVADEDELVLHVGVDELEVGQRRLVERAPVDDPVGPVEVALLVQVDEETHDGTDVPLVQREPLAPVVERGADAAELVHDRAAVETEPFPHAGLERLATELLPALPFPGELLLDGALGGDAGMVVAGLEKRVEALHPLHPDERVGESELERMPHVQLARHVRRRVGDDEALAARVGVGRVEAFLLPDPLPALLDTLRAVQGVHGVRFYGRTI